MPKKTMKDKLRADKLREKETISYTFNETSFASVTNKVNPEINSTRYIKKDLTRSLFLTIIGLTALIFLFYTI